MQINLNTQTLNKPNFGMAIHSNDIVNSAIQSRIKNLKELDKLSKIIDQQAKNDKVDINLFVMPDGKSLSANVFSKDTENSYWIRQFSENIFSKLFGGPVEFIERLAKTADKQAAKLKKEDLVKNNEVFKKLK